MKMLTHVTFRLLLLLTALGTPTLRLYSQQVTGCERFYGSERLSTIAIAVTPILAIRDLDDHSYAIVYLDSHRKKKTLRLYKNAAGENLRTFIKPGDLVKKLGGEYILTIARQLDNALDVRQFDLSCEN